MITNDEFGQRVLEEEIHPIFHMLDNGNGTNDVFSDGLFEGYCAYYSALEIHPEPLTAHTLYLHLNKLLQADTVETRAAKTEHIWRVGYIAGWSVGLAENDKTLFHEGFLLPSHQSAMPPYAPFVVNGETTQLEVLHRFAREEVTQYAATDSNGLYTITIAYGQVSCTCGQARCEHGRIIAKLDKQFALADKSSGQMAEVGA